MDYLSAISELNYMTQIVIMLYEDNKKVFAFGFLLPLMFSSNAFKDVSVTLYIPIFCRYLIFNQEIDM